MSSRTRWLAAVAAACAVAVPAAAQPPTSPLAAVPAGVPIVIQVRGWERVLGRLNVTLKAAAPDFAPRLAGQIESGIAEALTGRELKGLVKDGPIFLVFTEVPGDDQDRPEVALVARVASYTQFRDGILKEEERKELKPAAGYETAKVEGKEVYLLSRGDFAVLTPSQKALKLFQDKKAPSLAGKLDKALEAKLLESDVSAYVDLAAVNKKYGEQIAQFRMLMEQALEQAEGLGGFGMAGMGMAKDFYAQLFQLAEDGERVVASLDLPPEGFALKLHAQVGDKTKTNEQLKQARPVAAADLGKLPGGAMFYLGGSVGREWATNSGLMFVPGAQGGGQADKGGGDGAARELRALKLDEWASSVSLPLAGVFVGRYQDPAKATQAALKMFRELKEDGPFGGMHLKGKPEVRADAQKLGGFTLHHVKLAWDLDKALAEAPEEAAGQFKQMMEKLVGSGQQTWFGTDGQTYVEVTAKDWESARAMLEGYLGGKQPASAAAAFAAARQRLPQRGVMFGMVDMTAYTRTVFDAVAGMLKELLGEDKKLNPAGGPPSYIGFALGLEPRNITFDLWVPAAGVQQVLKMLAPFLEGLDR